MEDEWLIASNARFLLDEDLRELCVGDTMADRLRDVSGGSDLLSRTLAFDRVNYLHNVLQRMDKMTMAAGLEARVPFLDYRIIEFAATLGPSTKMPMLRTKAVVKKAGAGLISEQIIRRAKSGFGVPLADWMRRENSLGRYLDMLCEKRTLERGWWDRSTTVHFVQKHRGGEDHSDVLWSLINCELWARIMLDTSHLSSGEKELGTSVAFSKELSVM
jgi:asparagine synthase (glutamine-hydrolysing)